MLNEGDKAPYFSELNSGGKKVVLYFYPQDDTPTCTREGIEFSERRDEFLQKNAIIMGVSPDSPKSHEKFCTKFNLKITLLSDPEKKWIEAYGVWGEKTLFGRTYMGVIRSTFLIDEKGIIQAIWRGVRMDGHVDEVLGAFKPEPSPIP